MNQPEFRENVELAPFTTLSVGGPARYFIESKTIESVQAALEFADKLALPVFIFSGGSNVVVADKGFDGLAIRIAITGRTFSQCAPEVFEASVGAGEEWDAFVAEAVNHGLWGVECLSGIPGSVGGTPIQNVGAYGQEVAETISEVVCLDRRTGKARTFSNAECNFAYRQSRFNSTDAGKFVILQVRFHLRSNGQPELRYPDVAERIGRGRPTLHQIRETIISIRREKAMVHDPSDPNSWSAGSFFKNPIVSQDEYLLLRDEIPGLPSFPAHGDYLKVPAARLVEAAGFRRGFRLGNAGISERHSLAITNRGGATAEEIVALARMIRDAVRERFGVELVPEPVFIGIDL